ncbi:EthD domain-containing protein [Prauserella flavalba]|uniref:EthD domain-containing protein n=1 Tax=Prauserella flavalba TaxID=1477506 RepID=A0A318LAD1_9PSEU|nr:EthD domain-containing protein [Prauserella flavalba]PXY18425.1 hypothetical protein BA062_35525 [Prauserella flavalba]
MVEARTPSGRKLFALIVRRPGLSQAAFSAHWRTVHGPLALRIPGLRHYVQNHVQPWPFSPVEPPVLDGISEAWLDDAGPEDGTGGLHADPAYLEGARRDEPTFMDVTRHDYLRVEETAVLTRSEGRVKTVLLARRRARTASRQFQEAWFGSPTELKRVPGLCRYVQNTVTGWPVGTARPAYDAVDELWWEDLPALRAAYADAATWALLCRGDVAVAAALHVKPVVLR